MQKCLLVINFLSGLIRHLTLYNSHLLSNYVSEGNFYVMLEMKDPYHGTPLKHLAEFFKIKEENPIIIVCRDYGGVS